jgi:hypothetical protein
VFVRLCWPPPSFALICARSFVCLFPLVPVYLCLFPFVCLFPSSFGLRSRSFAPARLRPPFALVCARSPRSLVRACLRRSSVLVPICARSCGLRSHSFVLTCPGYPRFRSYSFAPARLFARLAFVPRLCPLTPLARSCLFPFVPVCVASVRARLCPLAPLTSPHMCLYQIHG